MEVSGGEYYLRDVVISMLEEPIVNFNSALFPGFNPREGKITHNRLILFAPLRKMYYLCKVNTNSMPNTKSSDIRYKVLDRCLRRGGYSTSELMNEVNKELEFHGFSKVTALNTIRHDMDYIASAYPDIVIEDKKVGRNITYSYRDPESSIFKLPFNDDELAQLSQCMAILSKFEGTPQMEWMHTFIERFKLSLNIDVDGKKIVGFDECRYLRGKEYFAQLLSAICNKQVLAIAYKSFVRGTEKEVLLHPYYIKEYNNRWFLLGREHGFDSISHLAFDRIERINPVTGVTYIENKEYDFNDDYFSDIIGVTKRTDCEPEKIRLWVADSLYPYIQTKPLHESQKVKGQHTHGYEIEIEVRPNYELEQMILSYGERMKVFSPESLRERIKGRFEEAIKNYE